MYTAEQKARIKWACRRGMLELDVVIMPFSKSVLICCQNRNNRTLWRYWKVTIPIFFVG